MEGGPGGWRGRNLWSSCGACAAGRKAAATADVAALQRHLLRWQYVESAAAGDGGAGGCAGHVDGRGGAAGGVGAGDFAGAYCEFFAGDAGWDLPERAAGVGGERRGGCILAAAFSGGANDSRA